MDPVASVALSGDQETASTQEVCPFIVYLGVPVSQSHILAVESPLPVAKREQVTGEKAVQRIASPWPGIEDEQRLTARTRKTAYLKVSMLHANELLSHLRLIMKSYGIFRRFYARFYKGMVQT